MPRASSVETTSSGQLDVLCRKTPSGSLGRPGALSGRPEAFLGRLGELGPPEVGLLKPSRAL
eukprot:5337762-Pyramimonas_sp.AAC.1